METTNFVCLVCEDHEQSFAEVNDTIMAATVVMVVYVALIILLLAQKGKSEVY